MLAQSGQALMRSLYTFTLYLLTPVILYRLAARGLRLRGYFSRWLERFGFFPDPGLNDTLWIHAVSVGEVNAAAALINTLRKQYSNRQFVVTTVTPTGSDRVVRLWGDKVFHVYLPYDLPAAVGRFLDRIRPKLAVIMETEIWPNLFLACRERGIPIIVANARLSERSLRGYGPVRPLARLAIGCATHVAAQSASDAERLVALGADPARLSIAGNLKFDMAVPSDLPAQALIWRAAWGIQRPVWMAASTHEGEELAVMEAHNRVLHRFPDALLLIAPRHPERFRPVTQLCRNQGFHTGTRREDRLPERATECFVVDTLGELLAFYACADVAFVGGSLVTIGGHNLLEPAALGVPVVVGPHTFNFSEITELLLGAKAIEQIKSPQALGPTVRRLLINLFRRDEMGRQAQDMVERERGAIGRVLAVIHSVLGQPHFDPPKQTAVPLMGHK